MSFYMILYAFITIFVVLLQGYSYWLNSKGKIPYKLNIVVTIGHLISNVVMVLHDVSTFSILFWTPLEIWIIAMMIKGLRREKRLKTLEDGTKSK